MLCAMGRPFQTLVGLPMLAAGVFWRRADLSGFGLRRLIFPGIGEAQDLLIRVAHLVFGGRMQDQVGPLRELLFRDRMHLDRHIAVAVAADLGALAVIG